MKHKQKIKTASYFVNRFGKLSTSSLFYQIQEIAWEHAEKLGFGYDNLRENNHFWVLSRLLIKINRRPDWGENFIIETWPTGADGFLAYRDIRFLSEKGEVLINATTSWLVLDLNTKRIIRHSELKDFPIHKERVFEEFAGKVDSPKENEISAFSQVLFNEIDINQHFNSGRYLERIIDSYDFDFHELHELEEFELNFAKEGVQTDMLAVKKQFLDNDQHLCSVIRQSDGKDLVRAKLVWKKRK